MSEGYVAAWAAALTLTLVVETPLYVWLSRTFSEKDRSLVVWMLVGLLASLITHPCVWFVWPRIIDPATDYGAFVLAAECFAVLAEALWLRLWGVPLRYSVLISLAANMSSVAAGEFTRSVFGWP